MNATETMQGGQIAHSSVAHNGSTSGAVATVAAQLEMLADEAVTNTRRLNHRSGVGRYARAAQRWWCILQYHHKEQLARRLWSVVRNRLPDPVTGKLPKVNAEALMLRPGIDWRPLLQAKTAERDLVRAAENLSRLRAGRYRFLNKEIQFGEAIDWRMVNHVDVPHLWRFHLHYHEYLLDCLAVGHDDDASLLEIAWPTIVSWIRGNSVADRRCRNDAWHPFCISRRLPVWCLLWAACPPPADVRENVLTSMASQAAFLQNHLEKDLGGNHLLENARALAFSGAFFGGKFGDGLIQTAAELIQAEIPRQVLPYGEHFERSPMYHAQMLAGFLDVRDLARTVDPKLAKLADDTGKAMGRFLNTILHPDGEIPLLGDSALGEAPPAWQLIRRANFTADTVADVAASNTTHTAPYWTWRVGDDFLIFDAAPVAPDHLPAHGHSDLLNIEATVGGHRLIVDSGVFNYTGDQMRQYCRSTRAHSVLQVDDQEQCDVWSRFRMGRRGWPSPLCVGDSHRFSWAGTTHNAYRYLNIEIGRWIACKPAGPWIIVDWAIGGGSHKVVNRLHLHPDVQIELASEDRADIRLHDVTGSISIIGAGRLSVGGSWFCPEFGRRIARPVLQVVTCGDFPCFTGWCWKPGGCEGEATIEIDQNGAPVVSWKDRDESVSWCPLELVAK